MERANIHDVKGKVLVEFNENQGTFDFPRGRYSIEMYSRFMRMHGTRWETKHMCSFTLIGYVLHTSKILFLPRSWSNFAPHVLLLFLGTTIRSSTMTSPNFFFLKSRTSATWRLWYRWTNLSGRGSKSTNIWYCVRLRWVKHVDLSGCSVLYIDYRLRVEWENRLKQMTRPMYFCLSP